MKKIVFLVKVIAIIIILFIGLYFVYKSIAKNNLVRKQKVLDNGWVELLKSQDEKNDLLSDLIKNSPKNVQYIDSLKISLLDYMEKRKKIKECNQDFVYRQYLSNKYMLPLLMFYAKDTSMIDLEKKKTLKNIQENQDQLNKDIEKYNASVMDYNLYYSSFPNFIIAKSYGFKRKEYFEIQFGVESVDPEVVKKERRNWQRKIEQEHGISE